MALRLPLVPLSASLLALTACSDGVSKTGSISTSRVSIVSNDGLLATRVTSREEPLAVQSPPVPNAFSATRPFAYDLTLIAEVAPPEVDGVVLQANSVAFQDGVAIVSYNVAGDVQKGAVDVFVLDADKLPHLTSRATFADSDVNAAAIWKDRVYLASATADETFGTPAVVEGLGIDGEGKLTLDHHFRTALSSYAATSVGFGEGLVFATSGNGGGVYGLDRDSGEIVAKAGLEDARWLTCPGDGTVITVRGTPGEVDRLSAKDLSNIGSFPFEGANVAESKSTVEVVGNDAFVAGGPAGTFIIDLATGAEVGRIPIPDGAHVDAETVTNAVSVDGDLVFVSNGSGGVYVVQASQDLTQARAEVAPTFELVGRIAFSGDGGGSVNHIVYRDGFLFVATGRAGLKIVRVSVRPCVAVGEIPENQIDDDCDGTVDELVSPIGCADGAREGFVDAATWPDVAACSGAWTIGGVLSDTLDAQCDRAAGDDGSHADGKDCDVADLCADGWHVCNGEADLVASSPNGCKGADPTGGQFFLVRQSGTGCGVCARGTDEAFGCSSPTSCQRGCEPSDSLSNDVFGCGSLGSTSLTDCGVLERTTGDGCGALKAPWACRGGFAEAATITKSSSEAGGVVCCRDR